MRKKIFVLNEVFIFSIHFIIWNTSFTYSFPDITPLAGNDQSKDPTDSVVNYKDYSLSSTSYGSKGVYNDTQHLLYNDTGDESVIQQIYPSQGQQNFNGWFTNLLNNSAYDYSANALNFTNMFPGSNASRSLFYKLPNTFDVYPGDKPVTVLNAVIPPGKVHSNADKIFKNSNKTVHNDQQIYVNIPHIKTMSLNGTKNSSNLLNKFFNETSQIPGKWNKPIKAGKGEDSIAQKISNDMMTNSTSYLNNMLSKLGLQRITTSGYPAPINLYKLNTSTIFNTTNASSVPYIAGGATPFMTPVNSTPLTFISNNTSLSNESPNNQTRAGTDLLNETNSSNGTNNSISFSSETPIPKNISFSVNVTDLLSEQYGKIVYSSVFFVHGSSTPPLPYPADPYNTTYWPEGINELTKKGEDEMYELGKWLQQRYHPLIGTRYNVSLMNIESAGLDVTLTSAECLSSGIFPPSILQQWDNPIHRQPIPIHSAPPGEDKIILMTKPCKMYNNIVKALDMSPEWLQFYDDYKEIMYFIGNSTSTNMSREDVLDDLRKIYYYYQDLRIEENRGLTLPNWTERVYPELLTTIATKYIKFAVQNRQLQKLKTGPFFKTLVDNFSKKIDSNSSSQFLETLHLYSGESLGLGFIMETLGIFNSIIPPNAAALIFDLRYNKHEFIVTVSYKNDTGTTHLLTIPNCQPICSYNNFVNITNDLFDSDWDTDCNILTFWDLTYIIPIVVFGAVIIFILAVIVALMCAKCIKFMRGKKATFR